jgi:hypothetical protein
MSIKNILQTTPNILATIIAASFRNIPYNNQSDIPIARTKGIKYDMSSSRFVLYPWISCGMNPTEVIAPAANPIKM